MAKRIKPLTDKQKNFIDAFLGEHLLDPIKSYEAAGYAHSINKYSESMRILNSDAVIREINKRMSENDTAFWINEGIIIKQLWQEAMDKSEKSTQAARINALVWIGKHLGMWQEKKEEEKDTAPQIQIINYGIDRSEMEKEINKPEVVEQKDSVSLPEGISITDYSDTDTKH